MSETQLNKGENEYCSVFARMHNEEAEWLLVDHKQNLSILLFAGHPRSSPSSLSLT